MHSTTIATPSRALIGPVGLVGRLVLNGPAYLGGVTLLSIEALGAVIRPFRRHSVELPGFWKTLMHQLFWMLLFGFPLVGLVHIAMGSFLSLQAYYGSTFVDGTGAVVGVGLLRNLGGLMTGLIFSAIMAVRMIPELRILARQGTGESADFQGRGRLAAPRIASRRRRVPLPVAVGDHRRHRGRLASLAVDDGPVDRDLFHDAGENDVVPRCGRPDHQRLAVWGLARRHLLL